LNAVEGRVVIDTNVWISAALSTSGSPAQLIKRVLSSGSPVFSAATFTELEARLWRPKFDSYLSLEARRAVLHDAKAVAHWVEIPPDIALQRFSRDADDDKFIHTALASSARWLVTGDQDLLVLREVSTVRILRPAEAMQLPNFCRSTP
jgi:uncharacterized protein